MGEESEEGLPSLGSLMLRTRLAVRRNGEYDVIEDGWDKAAGTAFIPLVLYLGDHSRN